MATIARSDTRHPITPPKPKPKRIAPPRTAPKAFRGRKIKAPGLVLWEGPSELNGEPIVVVANKLDTTSMNRKTGPMVQVYILLRDEPSWEAITNGADEAVCGCCKMRALEAGGGGRTCFVQVWPYVETVWKTYRKGRYRPIDSFDWNPLEGRQIRVGEYGDPAAVPTSVWAKVLDGAKGWTAYTHLWPDCDQALRRYAMASVDTPAEYREANPMGWRTFRSRLPTERIYKNELMCPAAEEAGKKTQCIKCGQCDGRRRSDKRKNRTIIIHGQGKFWFEKARAKSEEDRDG